MIFLYSFCFFIFAVSAWDKQVAISNYSDTETSDIYTNTDDIEPNLPLSFLTAFL